MTATADDAIPFSLGHLKSRLTPFCQLHGVASLEVFGSAARGEMRPGSDLDLLVTFLPDVHLGWEFFALDEELEKILGCKVDLLTRRSVERDTNTIRRRSILESVQEIYAS